MGKVGLKQTVGHTHHTHHDKPLIDLSPVTCVPSRPLFKVQLQDLQVCSNVSSYSLSLSSQLNSTLEAELGLLQTTLDGRLSSLKQALLQNEASDISKAVVQEIARAEVKDYGAKQIEAARKQWLKEVKYYICPTVVCWRHPSTGCTFQSMPGLIDVVYVRK